MPFALNNITTTDKPTVLLCAGTARLNFDVANAAIYFELGHGTPGITWDGVEVYMTPSFRSLDRVCDAVRVRSAKTGTPAQVTVHASTREEIGA